MVAVNKYLLPLYWFYSYLFFCFPYTLKEGCDQVKGLLLSNHEFTTFHELTTFTLSWLPNFALKITQSKYNQN